MSELYNKRVLVTRPRKDYKHFAQLLSKYGAEPVPFPVIKIAPVSDSQIPQKAFEELGHFDWLVFTSANGVKMLDRYAPKLTLPPLLKVAAVGPKTAEAIQKRGWQADVVPERYVAKAILQGLGNISGKRILLARGNLSDQEFPAEMRALGADVTDLVVYRTDRANPDPKSYQQFRRSVDVITFTSASAVFSFVSIIKDAGMDIFQLPGNPIFAYIGPITSKAAQDNNLPLNVIAQQHTLEGLVDALIQYYSAEIVKSQ